ncbi:MAG: VOC family protein [Actinomycetota bacterium]
MALHTFAGMDIGVPEPDTLAGFFDEVGLDVAPTGEHWGTADMPEQIRILERPFRQLVTMRLGCDDESDLAETAQRLDRLGVPSSMDDGRLIVPHPGHGWQVAVEPTPRRSLTPPDEREINRPGERGRANVRAEVITESTRRPPRRLAHVVVGAPDTAAATTFFTEGIGMKISDDVGGVATFMRCSTDHHNLLIQPSGVPYLNHYALEMDDIDAVGASAGDYLRAHGDERHVVGIGRHTIGANVFWYMNDPCGTMFELFSDMDDIPDDDAWEIGTDWTPGEFATWGAAEPPIEFFIPSDIDEIAAGFDAQEG